MSLCGSITGNSGKHLDENGILFIVLIHPFSRNHPDDSSEPPVTFDDMLETFNQLAMYISKEDFKKDFWSTEIFLHHQKPNYIKLQQAWQNRITHYTPRDTPAYDDVPVEGVIEEWDPKIKTSQIKTVKISPMFGADAVRRYKDANETQPATAAVKSLEAADKLRAVIGMDIKFMGG